MRTLKETPAALVENGEPHFGVFKTPFRQLNLLDADPFGWKGLSPRCYRKFRLKEWQHFSVVTPTHFLGLAVVDAKVMGVSWCYLFDRETRQLVEHSRQAPLRPPTISRELLDSKFRYRARDYEVDVHNHLDAGEHLVTFSAKGKKDPPISGRLQIREKPGEVQPLICVLPIGESRVFYTHKAPCPVAGEISVGDRVIALNPETDFAILDIHKSYYPYRTWWKWSTFVGRDEAGGIIGANLTRGLHGNNALENENCIWHGNRITLVSDAEFEIPENIMEPWRITTADGRADLTFTPQGLRQETLDFKIITSWYMAPLGAFSGTLVDGDGTAHEVKDVFGISEHHRVTW